MAARGGRGAHRVDENEHGDRREHDLSVGERHPRDRVQEAHERKVDRRVEARGDVDKVGPGAVGGHVEGGGRGLYAACMRGIWLGCVEYLRKHVHCLKTDNDHGYARPNKRRGTQSF